MEDIREKANIPFHVRRIVSTSLLELFTLSIVTTKPGISQKVLKEGIENNAEFKFSKGRFSNLLIDMEWRGLIFIRRNVKKNIGGGKGQMEIEITNVGKNYYEENIAVLRRVVKRLIDIR